MLLKFTSKSTASVLMLAEHALPILQVTGKDMTEGVPERGVYTPEQLKAAVPQLQKAMAEAREPSDQEDEEDEEEHGLLTHPMDLPVYFKQRAFPLYEMMQRSLQDSNEVMWEPADTAW